MKAVIMAGGQGTRLRPLTSNQPKPMIRIANLPCMEHSVNLLARHGITDVAVTLQFMPEEIQDYFGDGSEWGVSMRYSIEDAPAGTEVSVRRCGQPGRHPSWCATVFGCSAPRGCCAVWFSWRSSGPLR